MAPIGVHPNDSNAPSGRGSGTRDWGEGEKEALLARAIVMRKDGSELREIEAAIDVDKGTISRWLKKAGAKKPSKRQVNSSRVKHAKKVKAVRGMDRARNTVQTSDRQSIPERPPQRVLSMPTDPTEFRPVRDKGGEWGINPDLLSTAIAVLRTYTDDVTAGRMVTVDHVERAKAVIVVATAMPIPDWNEFGNRRELWGAIRELSGVNREEVADRCGVSGATLSRWESRKRTPEAGQRATAHIVYKALQETALTNQESILVVESYVETELDGDREAPIDREDLIYWVATDTDMSTFSIDHVHHLAQIRSMLPVPTFREPAPSNWFLNGYWEALINAI